MVRCRLAVLVANNALQRGTSSRRVHNHVSHFRTDMVNVPLSFGCCFFAVVVSGGDCCRMKTHCVVVVRHMLAPATPYCVIVRWCVGSRGSQKSQEVGRLQQLSFSHCVLLG